MTINNKGNQIKIIRNNTKEIVSKANMWHKLLTEKKQEDQNHIKAILKGKKKFLHHTMWETDDMRIVSLNHLVDDVKREDHQLWILKQILFKEKKQRWNKR